MSKLLDQFQNSEEYNVADVLAAFNEQFREDFANFIYSNPINTAATEQEQVLSLARSVINLANDYRRVANQLHNLNK
jgi:hypothetical protein